MAVLRPVDMCNDAKVLAVALKHIADERQLSLTVSVSEPFMSYASLYEEQTILIKVVDLAEPDALPMKIRAVSFFNKMLELVQRVGGEAGFHVRLRPRDGSGPRHWLLHEQKAITGVDLWKEYKQSLGLKTPHRGSVAIRFISTVSRYGKTVTPPKTSDFV